MAICAASSLKAAFANDDPSVFAGGRFDGEGDDRTLVVINAGIGADLRMHGKIAGSPVEAGSGYICPREALRKLALNQWIVVDQTVSDLRVRLGARALKPNGLYAGSRS